MGQLSAKYASMTDGQAVSKSPGALGLSALQSCFCIEHLRGEFLAAKFRAEIIGNFRRWVTGLTHQHRAFGRAERTSPAFPATDTSVIDKSGSTFVY